MRRKLALGVVLLGASAAHPVMAQPGGAPAASASGSPAPVTAERSDPRQGIVRLERAGQPLGFGVVLRTDGRILTALSVMGHGNDVKARFSDGALLPVHVVLSDRVGDLALLTVEGVHWTKGLRPSMRDPSGDGARLRRFRGRGGPLEEMAVAIEARRSLIGRDGAVLHDMLLVQGRFADDELGSPLIDESGEVIAIVVEACSPEPAGSCRMAASGAPMTTLKSFLKRAPPREPLPAARLGFRGAAAHEGSIAGVRVLSVDAGSPAALAGLRAATAHGGDGGGGDLVVAVDDAPVTTPEELSDAINRVVLTGAGQRTAASGAPPNAGASASATEERQVRLLVYGSGKFRQAAMPLRPMPRISEPTSSAAPAPKPVQKEPERAATAPTPSLSPAPPAPASPAVPTPATNSPSTP